MGVKEAGSGTISGAGCCGARAFERPLTVFVGVWNNESMEEEEEEAAAGTFEPEIVLVRRVRFLNKNFTSTNI